MEEQCGADGAGEIGAAELLGDGRGHPGLASEDEMELGGQALAAGEVEEGRPGIGMIGEQALEAAKGGGAKPLGGEECDEKLLGCWYLGTGWLGWDNDSAKPGWTSGGGGGYAGADVGTLARWNVRTLGRGKLDEGGLCGSW